MGPSAPQSCRLALVGLAIGLSAAPLAGQAQPVGYLDDLPPLLDREVFFGDPAIAYAALSPDGRFLSFVKEVDGVLNVWVKGLDEPWEAARPVTNDRNRPVFGYFWSEDGSRILWAQDQDGDENFRVYAADPAAEPAPGDVVPAPEDLTPYADIRAQIISVPEADPDHILVGLNDRDPRLHDVYRVDIRTGERELVFQNRPEHNISGWTADLEGNLRLGSRIGEDAGTEIVRVEGDGLVPVYGCTVEETCDVVRFHADGKRVYLETNRGPHDLTRLVLLDPMTGEETLVEEDPEGRADFGGAIFSRATDELLATTYTDARVRIYPKDDRFARDLEVLRRELPEGDLFFRTPTGDDRLWIVKPVMDVDNGPNYLYDRETGEVELLYRPHPEIPTEHMAPMKPVSYTARDGLEIPAYLTVPKGVEAEGLAAVVLPHGGPWGRDGWGWDSIVQFLANRGYAVLQPNFRGSTGYGKEFLHLGDGEWGTGTMQHDITDGAKWLVEQGIADPERIAIMGGSYGGYATLAGVAFTPELYAAGVDIVGPSNILTLLASIPPYWKPIEKMFHARVGDPSDPSDLERLQAQSPLNAAADIRAPLMVVQGANDPRVKKAESDQIVAALRDLGREVEYLVAADEGHGFAREENSVAMFAAVERFLARHVGGRHQQEVRPEIAEVLERLTVDISTVSLPEGEEE